MKDHVMTEMVEKSTELAPADAPAPAVHTGDALLAVIERVAMNPEADIDKMERLLEMRRREEDRQAERAYNTALAAVQSELRPIVANKWNDQTKSRYANMEAISNAAKPILSAYGFAPQYRDIEAKKEGFLGIEGCLRHRDGHKEYFPMDVPMDSAGIKGNVNKTQTHAYGSTKTYARRYCLMDMLDIAITPDNDGNANRGRATEMLTPEQYLTLRDLIDESGVDEAKFLAWVGAVDLDTFPAKHFDRAVAELKKRRGA